MANLKKARIISVNAKNNMIGKLADGTTVFSNAGIGPLEVGNWVSVQEVTQTKTYQRDADNNVMVDAAGNKILVDLAVPRTVTQVMAQFGSIDEIARASADSYIVELESKAYAAQQTEQILEKYSTTKEAVAAL